MMDYHTANPVNQQGANEPNYDCPQDDPLLRIFIKVHVWGGRSGRNIFVREGGLNWAAVRPHYKQLVDVCRNQTQIATPSEIAQAGEAFGNSVKNIGISFITKHIHFWTYVSRGENALPIFDSIMSNRLGIAQQWCHADCYWEGMSILLANNQGYTPWPNSMNSFERQLFKYFREHPTQD